MTQKRPTLYLIDASAMFYRAYFAFIRNPLINSKGENTSATYGLVNSLLKIIREEEPDYIAVAWDTKHPTHRHEQYSEYKSTRAKMPDELVAQLPRIRQAVEVLDITHFEKPGYEADDIIGTLAKRGAKEGFDVWCVTGDKDFYQLVDEHIRIYTPKPANEKPLRLGREEVKEKFGVYPEMVIDKLALMGDSSDNVPGIPGVGPKTADSLLEQFGSFEGVLERFEEIKAKGIRAKVGANIELARLSKKLVTIDLETPIDCKFDDLKFRESDFETIKSFFLEMEFHSLVKQLLPMSGQSMEETGEKPAQSVAYRTVTTLRDLKLLVEGFQSKKEIAVDTETTSLVARHARLVGVSLADKPGEAYYIPLGHDEKGNLPFDEAISELKKLLEDKNVQKIGQNLKYDLQVLHRYNIDINPISFDTMIASYVVNPSTRHGLDFQVLTHFGYQMQPISDLIGSGKNQKSFASVPIETATHYAAEDADYTYRLRAVHAPILDQSELQKLYYNIELPLIRVLSDMEEEGIHVDRTFLDKLSVSMSADLEKLRNNIYSIAGGEFNINSTQQLSHILFDKLGLPTKGKTAKKTGFSTDVKVLEELALLHPFPKLILEYRQFTKLKNTYVDAIPKLIDETTGRVHTSFNQTIAATGRLSSTDPNLQNIPVRTAEGRQIRKAFIPRDKEHLLLVADYSQIELRLLAHCSDDIGLIRAFKNKEDIHARTAAEVYGVKLEDVTKEQRRAAKTANFAVIYGASAYGLAQQTELDLTGARTFIDTYFERYPGIKEYMDRTKEFARKNGYVVTPWGRRRFVTEINDKKAQIRQFAERVAINTPIQGGAADMIKIAMLKIHKKLLGMKSRMVLQVHDELIFDVHKTELKEVTKIVKIGMEKAVELKVPIVVDIGVGQNWLEAK